MQHPRYGAAIDVRPAVDGTGQLATYSIELGTDSRELLAQATEILPPGTSVYVPKLPRRTHADGLPQVRALHELGFKPVPHVAARSLGSVRELEQFLRAAVRETGTDRVLVIGGDDRNAVGPFGDSAAIVASGILEGCGIARLDVAGYPDGHPQLSGQVLREDMARKVELATRQNLSLAVITQFSFVPEQIADYCVALAHYAPGVPVQAGVVGPTSARRLLKFARICGVGTSLRAVGKLGMDSLRLVTQADPGRQVRELARRKALGQAGNLAGIHLFTFGGFANSIAWINAHAGRQEPAAESEQREI
jgi:methylenetetrahydrofolate reductase (NADPH)